MSSAASDVPTTSRPTATMPSVGPRFADRSRRAAALRSARRPCRTSRHSTRWTRTRPDRARRDPPPPGPPGPPRPRPKPRPPRPSPCRSNSADDQRRHGPSCRPPDCEPASGAGWIHGRLSRQQPFRSRRDGPARRVGGAPPILACRHWPAFAPQPAGRRCDSIGGGGIRLLTIVRLSTRDDDERSIRAGVALVQIRVEIDVRVVDQRVADVGGNRLRVFLPANGRAAAPTCARSAREIPSPARQATSRAAPRSPARCASTGCDTRRARASIIDPDRIDPLHKTLTPDASLNLYPVPHTVRISVGSRCPLRSSAAAV